ncbi:hypothetical protein NBRC10512_000102 [Rhodotorula toruloides]|uniref:RHTO0S09e06106g1_1 n=2 Tax=Rhodotorula toruloides TaxID=5286 RepID=A0A061B458_RHOTO|nr:uncharacterized protein RHTO_03983 [Rhodotorula toruloides NP11]EMS19939.1 hypothetical protein RHTO_03983 [Rhodotorula toruloides NP11]KAJ8292834.1 hypothetical protein OF846_004097 [Rhodotorula toruloides]CDR44552.1 RHTO0S09e06106g1_1 [Rhodotorula toruloides]
MFWLDEEEEQGSAAQQGSKRGREDEGADGPCRNRSKQQQEVVRIETGRSTRENGVTQSEAATCSAVATDAPPKTPRARTKSSSSPVAERHKRIGHFFDLPAEETAETAPSRSSDSQSRQAETAQTTPTRPSTPAKSRSRGPRQAQTRTASLSKNFNEDLPDVLSRSAVFPPVAGLFFNHYQPYLVDEPVEADFSSLLSDEFVRFACAVAPPEKWSAKPDRLQDNELAVPGLGRFIGMWQPNKAAIVAAAPLHRSRAYRSITSDLLPKFEAMTVVMQWIWENEEIGLPEVAGMVQTAPLPVYILIRTYASNSRYTRIRNLAFTDLHTYLRNLRSRSFVDSAALDLLTWLDEPSSRSARLERMWRFFCGRDGQRKSARGWEEWLEGAKKGKRRKREDLERWEREEQEGM